MKTYDPAKPLAFIHIPKTAGTSVRELFAEWFGANLLLHYKPKRQQPVHDLENPPEPRRPVAVYGHFNKERGVGVEKYYPQVDQFVTILRDPLERAVSGYFFKTQNEAMRRAFKGAARMTLDQYVERWPGPFFRRHGALTGSYIPGACNRNNFKEILQTKFIEVGVTEHLELSMRRIAEKLGFNFETSSLQRLNVVKRTGEVSHDVKARFMARHALEYEIYNYATEQLLK